MQTFHFDVSLQSYQFNLRFVFQTLQKQLVFSYFHTLWNISCYRYLDDAIWNFCKHFESCRHTNTRLQQHGKFSKLNDLACATFAFSLKKVGIHQKQFSLLIEAASPFLDNWNWFPIIKDVISFCLIKLHLDSLLTNTSDTFAQFSIQRNMSMTSPRKVAMRFMMST